MGACRGQEVIGILAGAALVTPLGRQGWAGLAVWTAGTGLRRLAKRLAEAAGLGLTGVTAGGRPEVGLGLAGVTARSRLVANLSPKSGPGLYFFLPATVLRAPRRVRALVRVR